MSEPEKEANEGGREGRGQYEPPADEVGWDERLGHGTQRDMGEGRGAMSRLPTTSGFTGDAAVATAHFR